MSDTFVLSGIIEGGPDAEFGDENRKKLLNELAELSTRYSDAPSTTWAFLWVCHIDKLQDIINELKRGDPSSPKYMTIRSFFSPFLWENVVSKWLSKSTTSLPSSYNTTPLTGSEQKGCKRNQGGSPFQSSSPSERRCPAAPIAAVSPTVTPTGTPAVAPSTPRTPRTPGTPGSQSKRNRKLAEKEETGTESITNILTMREDVHSAFDKALFALKPVSVSTDGLSMCLQFFWLERRKQPLDFVSLLEKPCLPADKPEGQDGFKFFHHRTNKPINSGDYIVLKTDNPTVYPLPSLPLLKMQWHLNRIAAMCAGAEPKDPSDDDDSDDDMAVYDLHERSFGLGEDSQYLSATVH
ncbi:uncharacterized protein ATNIH1004_004223 [Aspergillus tanneri]|uniref:HNH nuclease domain-containing protein n=1 Tax=Aspergillus tanneri TaxID=1220188 RepID=A0A5M9MMY3_9EURO|nr:uncharacterized protein ATNIH1004_004223 [Aspergillus tanneri]KAA8648338.1 hypothetical protein ATNIH1004_004223 [Aspergillus tanneri]